MLYEAFCVTAGCDAESGPHDEQEAAQDWALRHTGRTGHDLFRRIVTDHAKVTRARASTESHGVPPKRDASKLSIRLQGDPLTRVARGTAAHPARSRLRHRGRASDQAAQAAQRTTGSAKRPDAPARRVPGRR
ncbi:DUF7848 domain-containing protein [Streptomyces globosus]